MTDSDLYRQFQKSPIFFIGKVWGFVPQPIKLEYQEVVELLVSHGQFDDVKVEFFEAFEKGKHITWQQWLILLAIERAIKKEGPNKISAVSGHGVGKSSTMAWILIWYLFCFMDAQVGATAPTSEQIHDVLWKEVALWLSRMPLELSSLFEWQSGYLRVRERPETWFARARTARKETPEAIAGLHGEFVLIVVDEASGVPDEIYRSAEGSLTGENTLVLLISNGTRTEGYFYDTHHSDKPNWQTLALSSEDSPIVEGGYVQRMVLKYGVDSDEYTIRVRGGFPSSEQMDDAGWIPLLVEHQIPQVSDGLVFVGRKKMGIDPSGEGDDSTIWLIRDRFMAKVVHKEQTSNAKSIARQTVEIVREYDINPVDITVDNLGEGANVKSELMLLDHEMSAISAVNWGEKATDITRFFNKRAECCWSGREWLLRGGAVVGDEIKRDIISYPYKNNLKGVKQIMNKPDLKKKLGRSPDRGDAFFLTFYQQGLEEISSEIPQVPTVQDPHSIL